MRGFAVFWRKEFREALRSGRTFILVALFLLLGISSPLAFKFLPLLVPAELSAALTPLLQPNGAEVLASLFKNLAQLGVVVLILLTMGAVCEEKSHGQLELVLARPISTAAILWAKFTVSAVQLLFACILAFGTFFLYTRSLFPPGPDLLSLLEGGSLFFLFGLLVIAFTLWVSVLLPTSIWAALASGLFFLTLSFLPNLGGIWAQLSPPVLLAAAPEVARGASSILAWWRGCAVCLGVTVVLVILASWSLRRSEL